MHSSDLEDDGHGDIATLSSLGGGDGGGGHFDLTSTLDSPMVGGQGGTVDSPMVGGEGGVRSSLISTGRWVGR